MAFGVKNFPTSLDDLLTLLPARDSAATQLTATLTTGAVSMTVADTSRFPTAGTLTFKGEHIGYTGKTSTTFTGLTRALFTADGGAAAQSGDIGDPVRLAVTARHHNILAEVLIAVQTKLGIGADTPAAGTVLKGTGAGTSAWEGITPADIPGFEFTPAAGASGTSLIFREGPTNGTDGIYLAAPASVSAGLRTQYLPDASGNLAISPTITVRMATSGSIANGSTGSVVVTCLTGEKCVGGGYALSTSAANQVPYYNFPSSNGWSVALSNNSGSAKTITAYAVCANFGS